GCPRPRRVAALRRGGHRGRWPGDRGRQKRVQTRPSAAWWKGAARQRGRVGTRPGASAGATGRKGGTGASAWRAPEGCQAETKNVFGHPGRWVAGWGSGALAAAFGGGGRTIRGETSAATGRITRLTRRR